MLLGWAALPKPWLWTSAVLTVVFLPCVLASLLDLVRKPKAVLLSQHIPTALRFSRQRLTQAFLTLAFMPYKAWLSLDALAPTLWRMAFSHRQMLEWTPSTPANADPRRHLDPYHPALWFNPTLPAILAG